MNIIITGDMGLSQKSLANKFLTYFLSNRSRPLMQNAWKHLMGNYRVISASRFTGTISTSQPDYLISANYVLKYIFYTLLKKDSDI